MSLTIVRRVAILAALSIVASLAATAVQLSSLWSAMNAERRNAVKAQVESAIAILQGAAAEATSGRLTKEEAQARAKDAIRSIRWGKNDYLFVYDLKGYGVVHPVRRDFEGALKIDLLDGKGVKIIPLIIDAAKSGGDYTAFYFPRAGSDVPILKVGYSKLFEPWGWVVGTGVYVDDLSEKFWDEVKASAYMTLGLVLMLCMTAIPLALGLVRPIKALTGMMLGLAKGDLTLQVPGLDRRDEVGAMAVAVEHFRQAGLQKIELEREAAATREATERERQQNAALQERANQEREKVVAMMADALSRLARNDLTASIPAAVPAGYERLRDDFNAAAGNLAAALEKVSGSAKGIASNTRNIASAADDLSRRTEIQASNIEETSAAMTEISKAIASTAEGTREAKAVASAAREETERTGEIVATTVEAIGGIERSAQQVSQIIGVIDEIAFQTNLLALNAGVEAARAGEAGRGFAVVASEVRALAQRSAEAAKEIKALITTSGTHVENGVRTVGAAQQALSKISAHVANIERVIIDIAAQSSSQADSLREVNQAISQLNLATQENAGMVEEATAACRELDNETDGLENLLAEFTTGAPVRMRAAA